MQCLSPNIVVTTANVFAGCVVTPAGQPKVRNNDCDYAFRPDSAFSYYTGLGQDYEAGAVLVLDPNADGTHTPMLFVAASSRASYSLSCSVITSLIPALSVNARICSVCRHSNRLLRA